MSANGSNNLKRLRLEAGLSQEALARSIVPPLTKNTIARLEAGVFQPTLKTARAVALALGVQPDQIWPLRAVGPTEEAAG